MTAHMINNHHDSEYFTISIDDPDAFIAEMDKVDALIAEAKADLADWNSGIYDADFDDNDDEISYRDCDLGA